MVDTESLLDGNQLSLTQLVRNITGNVAPKHNIKRIDRLLENPHTAKHKSSIYQ
ncbi:transposase, IS4 family protein [Shewanella sp. HN-41]|nr:transposase, IS4 family protein [Shewanella sp. HN-41]